MHLNDLQLDALREVSNIGSGTAATSLSEMIGLSVELSVPTVSVLSLADAVDAAGSPEDEATAVIVPVYGDLDATVLLLFPPQANTPVLETAVPGSVIGFAPSKSSKICRLWYTCTSSNSSDCESIAS